MQTQVEYFQAHADEHGNLTEDQMAQMILLPEGDTTKLFVEGGKPDAASDSQATDASAGKQGEDGKNDPPADDKAGTDGEGDAKPAGDAKPQGADKPAGEQEPKQVVLAKDGVHTIPFEKLTEARTEAQTAKQAAEAAQAEAQRLRQEVEALKKGAQPPAAGTEAKPGTTDDAKGDDVDFGDYSDEKIKAGVTALAQRQAAALVEQKTADLRAELEALKGKLGESDAKAQLAATEAHYAEIYGAHKDADSIVESAEFKAWRDAQPTFVRAGIEQTLAAGTAKDIVDVFTSYKQATGKTGAETKADDAAAAAKKTVDAAAAAQAAIAGAKSKPPTSLSEIPAGSKAPTDEAQAMLEMSSTSLMSKFEGKSPDEVMKLMAKVL